MHFINLKTISPVRCRRYCVTTQRSLPSRRLTLAIVLLLASTVTIEAMHRPARLTTSRTRTSVAKSVQQVHILSSYRVVPAYKAGQTVTPDGRSEAAAKAVRQAEKLREQGTTQSLRDALASYMQALSLWRAVGAVQDEAQTLYQIGGIYLSLGENRQAASFYNDARVLRRAAGDRVGEAWTLRLTAQAHRALGERRKALELLQESLMLWRLTGERAAEAEMFKDIGRLRLELSEYPQALRACEEAITLWRAAGDRDGEASTLDLMARIYFALNNRERLKELQTQAAQLRAPAAQVSLVVTPAIRDRLAAEQLRSEATQLLAQGTPDARREAIVKNEKALRLFAELDDARGQIATHLALGAAYSATGERRKSFDALREALPLSRATGDVTLIDVVLRSLGDAHARADEPQKSLDYYEQAIELWRTKGNRAAEAEALVSAARSHIALDKRDQALDSLVRSLSLYRELNDRTGEAYALSELMRAYTRFQTAPLAIFYGKQIVNLYQQIRADIRELDKQSQQSFLESKVAVYRALADLLIADGRLPEAQQILRMLKDEEYFEFIRRGGDGESGTTGDPNTSTPAATVVVMTPKEAEWQRRYDEIAAGLTMRGRERGELLAKETRTAADEERLKTLDADLMFSQQAFQKFLTRLYDDLGKTELAQLRVSQIEESQSLMEDLRELGAGVVALYTLVAADKYRVVLVTPDVQRAYEVPVKAADLNRKIQAFREALQDPASNPLPLAQELYRVIVAPVAKDLKDAQAETLMWSLDGSLRYLPVAALHDGKQYMIENYRNTLFTLGSTTRLKDKPGASPRGLGLGVSKRYPGFTALKAVPEELRGIIGEEEGSSPAGTLLPGKIFLDDAFTEDAMRSALRSRYPVVHIASHFVSQPGDAAASFLLLGDGKRLTLADIKTGTNLFGGVELLALSACDTATGGAAADGREVECFGGVAQRQGAKAVIATLWEVADRSTQMLMQDFYRRRNAQPGVPKAELLRQAQLTLLRGGESKAETVPENSPLKHPFFWAPFILIGNWR